MKTLIIILFLTTLTQLSIAQCELETKRENLAVGMIVIGTLDNNDADIYSSRITKVTQGGFECEFVHTNSNYVFGDFSQDSDFYATAKVVSNRGGKFAAGTIFKFLVYVAAPDACDLRSEEMPEHLICITTFQDGKTFLGFLSRTNDEYTIFYPHSSSTYTFDGKWKITSVKGGKYKVGQAVKIEFAQKVIL